MLGHPTSLFLLALTVSCVVSKPQDSPAQDPWLQILNGGQEDSQQLMVEPEYQLQGRQEQEYQLEGRQEQEYQLQGRQEQEYQLQGRQEQEYQLQGRQEQEPVQEIQQVQPRRPQAAQPPFQRRPQRPPQRFPHRPHQRPARPLRPRPGGPRKPPGPGEKGIFDKITGSIVSGYEGIKCSGANLITDAKLRDDSFIRFQLDCARDLGPCDEIGEKLKILAPEVLAGRCPKPCNECTKTQIKRVMAQLSQEYPDEFREMLKLRRGPTRGR